MSRVPDYPEALAPFIQPRLMALGPGQPVQEWRSRLQRLTVHDLPCPGQRLFDQNAAQCCLAGLWLLYNLLEECHRICQRIITAEGSYWHAVMHRREPDEQNSKYWWRRVGSHTIFPELARRAAQLAADVASLPAQATWLRTGRRWDPFAFVDLCAAVRDTGSPVEMLCRQIQLVEWQLLFDFCYSRAVAPED